MSNQINKQAYEAAAEDVNVAPRNVYRDLFDSLTELVNRHGRVELIRNSNGTADVRAGGVAAYDRSLRHALDKRIEIEASQVAYKIEGKGEDKISGAVLGQTIGGSLTNKP